MHSTQDLKAAIRAEALSKRNALSTDERARKGAEIARLLLGLPEFTSAESVLFYAAFRSEVPTEGLARTSLDMGKKVLMPKVNPQTNSLSKHVIECLSELEPGYWGIPEPRTDVCWRVEEIAFIVVPGVAFDGKGNRIGYGGGYYDRLLPRVKGLRPIVALAFQEQIFERIPASEHDVAMDMVITDQGILRHHG